MASFDHVMYYILTEGIDYALEGNSIHFTSYRDTYGHLNATLVAEFSVNPPRTEACANITILDDAILERITSKDFTVHFDSRSLPRERMMIESGVTVTILDDDSKCCTHDLCTVLCRDKLHVLKQIKTHV